MSKKKTFKQFMSEAASGDLSEAKAGAVNDNHRKIHEADECDDADHAHMEKHEAHSEHAHSSGTVAVWHHNGHTLAHATDDDQGGITWKHKGLHSAKAVAKAYDSQKEEE